MRLWQRWQILSITYWGSPRTQEMSRYLHPWPKYWLHSRARREVRRMEHRDELENRFDREYVVVKAT